MKKIGIIIAVVVAVLIVVSMAKDAIIKVGVERAKKDGQREDGSWKR